MPRMCLWIPLCSRVCNTLWQLPVAPGQGAQPGTWVMSLLGNTPLRVTVPRELTQLGQNHLWDLENELALWQEELHLSGV